jgi:hypothetical protein
MLIADMNSGKNSSQSNLSTDGISILVANKLCKFPGDKRKEQ